MSDETAKWASPRGHSIASHETDRLPAVNGMGVVVDSADDARQRALDANEIDEIHQWLNRVPQQGNCPQTDLAIRENIKRALTAKQELDAPRYDPQLGLIQPEPINQELLEALNNEVKYLNRVAALIEARNGLGSILSEEIAKPLRINALGLAKAITRATQQSKDGV